MRSKVVWLLVSCLMVVALVLSSCGPAVEEKEEGTTVVGQVVEKEDKAVVEEEEEAVGEDVAPADEGPVYGGRITLCTNAAQIAGFDPAYLAPSLNWAFHPVSDRLIGGDWWKGPAGTNECVWDLELMPTAECLKGYLVESWEMLDDVTTIFHVRKGVMWQDRPGVMAAREFTADDVVFNLRRFLTNPQSQLYGNPGCPEPEAIKALDKYTVEWKNDTPNYRIPLESPANQYRLCPPEVIEKYGDMQDWKNVVGTGAYILTDYVSGSSFTYERNPAYFMKDPEGGSLPYLDGFEVLVIPDASTRTAAIRSGKLTNLGNIPWSDAESLKKTNPKLMYYTKFMSYAMKLTLNSSAEPYSSQKVRRALSMALDRYAIAEDFYKGNAEVVTGIAPPIFKGWGARVDELPPSQKELFEYDPEKAKQLLAEAGYPNGFKTTIDCYEPWTDLVSVIKSYWDAVGVETDIKVHEVAALYGAAYAHTIEDVMMLGYTHTNASWSAYLTTPAGDYYTVNWGCVNDPFIDELHTELSQIMDENERRPLAKELNEYIVDQAYDIFAPTQFQYNFWQPWLKGYHGESSTGWYSGLEYVNYVWIDQDLKAEMGH